MINDEMIEGVMRSALNSISKKDKISLKELRIKTKPGLLPPFYVDMPKTLEEIQASEKKYLYAYLKNPLKTDFNYFFKIS
jgi:hypothetical protein